MQVYCISAGITALGKDFGRTGLLVLEFEQIELLRLFGRRRQREGTARGQLAEHRHQLQRVVRGIAAGIVVEQDADLVRQALEPPQPLRPVGQLRLVVAVQVAHVPPVRLARGYPALRVAAMQAHDRHRVVRRGLDDRNRAVPRLRLVADGMHPAFPPREGERLLPHVLREPAPVAELQGARDIAHVGFRGAQHGDVLPGAAEPGRVLEQDGQQFARRPDRRDRFQERPEHRRFAVVRMVFAAVPAGMARHPLVRLDDEPEAVRRFAGPLLHDARRLNGILYGRNRIGHNINALFL